MRRPVRLGVAALVCAIIALLARSDLGACTAFCAVGANGQVLVGNNEDYTNPRTKLRFVPATPGSFGRMYVGFDDLGPQGGMNERGLWFDGFAAPAVRATGSKDLPSCPGNIVDAAMAECSTVEEVVSLFSRYNRAWLTEGILMFADATGDAVAIEPDAIVRKTGRHFVQTNFHQSRTQIDPPEPRFATASSMLAAAGGAISVDLARRILASTDRPRLEPARLKSPATWVRTSSVQLTDASMERLAAALQSVLGRPVIDDTGLEGSYDLQFGWEGDRVASVTATLRDRFGLRLSPATRDLEALVVDRVRPDAALLLVSGAGRLSRGAPGNIRQALADLLTIR